MNSKATSLGTVEDVRGATISVVLESSTVSGLIFFDGHGYRVGQIGSFVRIPIGYIDLFGIVTQVGAGAVPEKLVQSEPYGRRWMTVELVGEEANHKKFQRGLSQYPTIGDSVHLVTISDLAKIYGRPGTGNYVQVGHLASAEAIPTLVNIDKLVTRHSAILGATGSGKSTTVASILTALSNKQTYPSARIIIFDIHGEYAAALKDRATVVRVNADLEKKEKELYIPYWAMTSEELLSICTGIAQNSDDKIRGAIVEKITELKRASLAKVAREGITANNLTADSPVPFSIHKLWFDLHCDSKATYYGGSGQPLTRENWALEKDADGRVIQSGEIMRVIPPVFRRVKNIKDDPEKIRWGDSQTNLAGFVDVLASKLRDPRYNFLFRPGPWLPNEDGVPISDLDILLKEWLGGEEPITILDLSGIPPLILTNLIGSLLRIIYDALFWARNLPEGGRERPLLLVLEEAHAYLSQGDKGFAANAVKRIAKEGRKYGIGAMIISQRPVEVDRTVLSQCGTIFALRLSNTTDRASVAGATSDNLSGLFDMLPVLRTGEIIITGEAVHLPVRTVIDPPSNDRKPDSSDPVVFDPHYPGGWNNPQPPDCKYCEMLHVWRKQETKGKSMKGETMQRVPVTSSNIMSVGYDGGTLEVEFHNGRVYQYFEVPETVYTEMLTAGSVGQYFNSIKGLYRYSRL